jgi:hypothetical protein
MIYVLDNVPEFLDRALRERAAAEHKSPETIILNLVASGLNATSPQMPAEDTCSKRVTPTSDDPDFETILREQNLIDWEAWSDGIKRRDLSGIAGQHLITPEMKEVFAEQRRIDPDLWK